MRPRGCPRMWTPGAVTAASIRGVWSAAERSTACGAATTMSKRRPIVGLDVDRAVGADVRLDAGEQAEATVAVARSADRSPAAAPRSAPATGRWRSAARRSDRSPRSRRSRARGRPRRSPRASGCRRSTSNASAGRRDSRRRRGPARLASALTARTRARLRKCARRPRRRSTSARRPLASTARSTSADAPVASTSWITRVDDGPMRGMRARSPSGCTSRSIGSSSARMALAACL